MSGGKFDYVQSRIRTAADDLERYIARCEPGVIVEYGAKPEYSKQTLAKFRQCEQTLRQAAVMIHCIDYLACGDYSEESFTKQWTEQVLSP